MSKILILNEPLPEDLRRKLERDAKAKGVSMNDLVCAILCERYGLECEPGGNPYRPVAERFKLRVPEQLRRELSMEAAVERGTIRGFTLSILASHYGLAPIDTGRRPRRVA